MRESLLSLTFERLMDEVISLGEKSYRASQLFNALHLGKSLDEMTNIPALIKSELKKSYDDKCLEIIKEQVSKDGTRKFLYKLNDGNVVEGVLMEYKFGYTLCVSTQVGCRMNCSFCASCLDGLVRNLSAGEIMSQVIMVNKYLLGDIKTRKVTNIVLMGSGEPLDNYANVLDFIKIANDKHGLNYSDRNISLSTCGLVQNIYKLADENRQINLCLSLHAPTDEIRHVLMPVSRSTTIDELLKACKYYATKTNRRILFEYILINGINSSKECARILAKKIAKINSIVNLINYNEVEGKPYKSCDSDTINNFANVLKSYNISVTTRRSLGKDIDGACGQLRRKFIENKE